MQRTLEFFSIKYYNDSPPEVLITLSSVFDSVNISSKGLNSDIHASAEYRAHIIKVMAKKAVSSC